MQAVIILGLVVIEVIAAGWNIIAYKKGDDVNTALIVINVIAFVCMMLLIFCERF